MSIPWEQARDEWAKRKIREQNRYIHGEFAAEAEIVIRSVDINDGETVQIGDMTWDHVAPHIEIDYTQNGLPYSDTFELDFGELVREIVAVAEDLA